MPQRLQQVWAEAHEGEAGKHQQQREVLCVSSTRAGRGDDRRAGHAHDDREDRKPLASPSVLAEHPFPNEHQHEQPRSERRLHDHQRRQQQRQYLQRPAEDRESGAEQPAGPSDQSTRERESQVCSGGRLLRVHRLQRDA